jgi:hypothetical protein
MPLPTWSTFSYWIILTSYTPIVILSDHIYKQWWMAENLSKDLFLDLVWAMSPVERVRVRPGDARMFMAFQGDASAGHRDEAAEGFA